MNKHDSIPPLLRRGRVVAILGVSVREIEKLTKSGVLQIVKPCPTGRAYYRKIDLEKVFKIQL